MRLENWIDRSHLSPESQAAHAASFSASPHASIAIDDFLQPEKLAALRRVFSTEGRFEVRHYLKGSAVRPGEKGEVPVAAEVWSAASDTDRASVEYTFVDAQPDFRVGLGIVTQCKFRELMGSPEFMDYLGAVTGIRPETLTGMMTRMVAAGQYIRPHSDFRPTRDLCGVFYLSPGWEPAFGGRFRHSGARSDDTAVEPLANRLLLFRPVTGKKHDVEAMTAAGSHWRRWAYTLWFGKGAT